MKTKTAPTYTIEAMAGDHFSRVAERALKIAREADLALLNSPEWEMVNAIVPLEDRPKVEPTVVDFKFNDIKCLVNAATDIELLARDYGFAHLMDWKTVGPDCKAIYADSVYAEIDKRQTARDEASAKAREEYRRKDAIERENFEKRVSGVEMKFSYKKGWDMSIEANKEGYGKAIMEYAEGWAKLMQIEISKGAKLADIVDSTGDEMNFMGITGFMENMAISILCQTWQYGETLRRWHNKRYNRSNNKKKNKRAPIVNSSILHI